MNKTFAVAAVLAGVAPLAQQCSGPPAASCIVVQPRKDQSGIWSGHPHLYTR